MPVIRIIFFFSIILFAAQPKLRAQQLLHQPYYPSITEGRLPQYFEDIERRFNTEIAFSELLLDLKKTVAPRRMRQSLGEILYDLLEEYPIQIVERNGKILIVPFNHFVPEKEARKSINGYVKDALSGEIVVGAIVHLRGKSLSAQTNNYGFFSLTLEEGYYSFSVHALGYETDTIDVYLSSSVRTDIVLNPKTILQTVEVVRDKKRTISSATQKHYQQSDIQEAVFPLGESDVFRKIQEEPGVTTGLDGSTGIRVRGGDPGQNLNLLDGVPVYNVDHLYGASSIYNTDAIKSVDFYKGAFPAKYGGRISSVIDVTTKDGDMQQFRGMASLGLVKGTVNLEGPIIKDKSSFFISARRTWADALLPFFIDDINLNFYDINVKFNYIINPNNRIYWSLYKGGDAIKEKGSEGNSSARWGNQIASLKWTSILSSRLFFNTSLSFSNFNYELNEEREVIRNGTLINDGAYTGSSSINDIALRSGLEWHLHPNHGAELGLHVSKADFIPTRITSADNNIPLERNEFHVTEMGGYFAYHLRLKSIELDAGVHFSNWINTNFDYNSFQPRLSLAYLPVINQKFYVSTSYMTQFLHLISNNTYGLPTDFWIPSTERIKPEQGLQTSLGFAGYKNKYEYSLEAYYKEITGVTLYSTGKDIFDNSTRWQDRVIQGRGWAYGLEGSFAKQMKRLKLSVSYTLSWNWRQFEELNQGNAFPHRYDRRHNLRIGAVYQKNNRFSAIANWVFMSGEAFTIPDQIYPDFDRNLLIHPTIETNSSEYTYSFSRWNNYRLPAIHRLDIAVQFSKKINEKLSRNISLGISNVYGRPNVWYARLEHDQSTNQLKLNGYTYTRFLPFFTYRINF